LATIPTQIFDFQITSPKLFDDTAQQSGVTKLFTKPSTIQEIHMSEKMIIPDEFQGSIKRLLNRIPSEQRDDETLQAALLVYLKLGGEKLARHYIEISKKGFPDQMVLIKKQLHDGVDEDEDSNGENPDDAERVEEFAADFNKPDSDGEVFV
jgi:hypothetical protein